MVQSALRRTLDSPFDFLFRVGVAYIALHGEIVRPGVGERGGQGGRFSFLCLLFF